MDDYGMISVEFVLPVEPEIAMEYAAPTAGVPTLGKCSCGGDHYVLANEMRADVIEGIPASRMFECMKCGTYRLG